MQLVELLKKNPIIPVVTLRNVEDGVRLSEALYAGGITVIEITLRTQEGLEAIAAVKKALPKMTVGAGTITNQEQFKAALDKGAEFIVSPGLTERLAQTIAKENAPFLPGVSTTTEIMHAREYGFSTLKFFPASLSGGVNALKQFSGLFPEITFCPTGGINMDNAVDYLRLKNVICVGGSWVAPDLYVNDKNWEAITNLSQRSLQMLEQLA